MPAYRLKAGQKRKIPTVMFCCMEKGCHRNIVIPHLALGGSVENKAKACNWTNPRGDFWRCPAHSQQQDHEQG